MGQDLNTESIEESISKYESISEEDYIRCYTSTSISTSEKEEEEKEQIKKALEIALDTRKFEIDLYWKRTAYFVLFISAVFIGYYNIIQTDDSIIGTYQKEWLLLLLAALGFLLSLLWYIANRGSKFWQENWEAHIEQLSMYSGVPIFSIINKREHSIRNLMQEYPFSVSKVNQMVSLIITFTWLIMLCKEMGLSKLLENIAYSCWYKVVVGGIVIMLSFAIIICCKGFAVKVSKRGDNIEERWRKVPDRILKIIGCCWNKIIDLIKLSFIKNKENTDNKRKDSHFFWNYKQSLNLKPRGANQETENSCLNQGDAKQQS